ncbi:NAD-dependent epimerase/dehydratase family protein [Chengkuizengella axinellae]|uniref:NAD(P)-dependent oxidoreductase n=1 Tax=Chengkuizengella axinellae TaxID=3064388 RepID=A0ABT9J0M1_9BACL|nr:NAD(P)-dependent oxidoreductase [Chengkuizengella sp. 2205SS18-9]MDP5275152.1 NAD(P)-dependent oxidoreductase [Chengkuizengella sp. 2205SS18-9]
MTKERIIVTGGSGKAGKWVIKDLIEHGYDVVNLDWKRPKEELCQTIIVDLNNLGEVQSTLAQYNTRERIPVKGIVHFAAIPQAFIYSNDVTFKNNVMNTYNILEAAANLGIDKVVLASSESSYGMVFASEFFDPKYLPVDEEHPQLPEDSYGLSKVINEVTAQTFNRRTGMQVISLRLGNILEPADYIWLRERFDKPEERLVILWSYIDARDVATACRLSIEKDGLGAQELIIAADDTSSNLPSKELIEKFLPNVKDIREDFKDRESLLSNKKLKEVLGWEQKYSWKE